MTPRLINVKNVLQKPYIGIYDLDYKLPSGKTKQYTIASRNDLTMDNLSKLKNNAITAFILNKDRTKTLLLSEFRMGINTYVYNTVSGLIDEGETPIEALTRELYEESGLEIDTIIKEFPPSYSSVGISDETVIPFIITVKDGAFEQHLEETEDIIPIWMDKQLVENLLKTSQLGARTQLFGHMFVSNLFDN